MDYQGSPCARLLILRNHWGKGDHYRHCHFYLERKNASGYILSSPQNYHESFSLHYVD